LTFTLPDLCSGWSDLHLHTEYYIAHETKSKLKLLTSLNFGKLNVAYVMSEVVRFY